MLVLARRKNQEIQIGEAVTLRVVEIRGNRVRLGIEAPTRIPVHRQEVQIATAEPSDKRLAAGSLTVNRLK